MKRISEKKGVSAVIATIMLILLTVIAVGFVAGVVIPMIKNWLSGTKCVNYLGKISIDDTSDYTCFIPNATFGDVKLTVSFEDVSLNEFNVYIYDSATGRTKSYNVKNGSSEGVSMFGGGNIELPGKREKRTYVFGDEHHEAGEILKVSLAPVVEGDVCDPSPEITLGVCS
jgi:flagellin-like protein